MSKSTVHVLLAGDEGIAPGLFVTTASLVCSSAPKRRLCVHFMNTGVSDATLHAFRIFVESLGWGRVELRVYAVDLALFSQANAYRGNYSAYARLLMGRYVEADRVVYCDTDFLFLKDVSTLYDYDMKGCPLLATCTPMYVTLADDCPFLSKDEAVHFGYFNSGILLVDLGRWHEENSEAALLDAMRQPVVLEKHDQTLLNWVFRGRWGKLDSSWGQLLCHDTDVPLQTNFHFGGGGVKPWQMGCHYSAVPLWWAVFDMAVRPFYTFPKWKRIRAYSYLLIWIAHVLLWAYRPLALFSKRAKEKYTRMCAREAHYRGMKKAEHELRSRYASVTRSRA